jgi:hypothetical protein
MSPGRRVRVLGLGTSSGSNDPFWPVPITIDGYRPDFAPLEAEHPWRGEGILTRTRLVIGCGLGVALPVAIVLSLTAIRKRTAALLRRERA